MNRFIISAALLFAVLGAFQTAHAQPTSPQACDTGRMFVMSSADSMTCRHAVGVLTGICSQGGILQRRDGTLLCMADGEVVPDSMSHGGSFSTSCSPGKVVTALTNGLPSSCSYIEDVLNAATTACANGSILRFEDGVPHCSGYLGLTPSIPLLSTTAVGTVCGSGQVMQRDVTGAWQCEDIAAVLAGAFESCANDQTIVFDEQGVPGCGGITACEPGQLAVLTRQGVACRNITDALSGLCDAGKILQKSDGMMQCATNDNTLSGDGHIPQSDQRALIEDGIAVCNTNQVATRNAQGQPVTCTNLGQLIDTMTSPCTTGHLLRFDVDGLRCNDYSNETPTPVAWSTSNGSAAEPCIAGQVLRITELGLRCENLATVLEEAYGESCDHKDTIVFGDDGTASCGKAVTTCPAGVLEWSEGEQHCEANIEQADIGTGQEIIDFEGTTGGVVGSVGRATYQCIRGIGEFPTSGRWSGPLRTTVHCGVDPKVCGAGTEGYEADYHCAAESPGDGWEPLPESTKYCVDEDNGGLDSTRSCYVLIPPPTEFAQEDATDTSITLRWDAAPGASRYHISRYDNDDCSGEPSDFSTSATSQALTDLAVGRDYSFKVRTEHNGTQGNQSTSCLSVATTVTPPSPVVVTEALFFDDTSITLIWQKSRSPRSVEYTMKWYDNDHCGGSGTELERTTERGKLASGLTLDTTYSFQVKASNLFLPDGSPDPRGDSDWSPCRVESVPITPPTVPENLRAVATGPHSITMRWDESASYRHTQYTLIMYPNSSSCTGPGMEQPRTWETEMTLTGLDKLAVYSFRVMASNLFSSDGNPDPRGNSDLHPCVGTKTGPWPTSTRP